MEQGPGSREQELVLLSYPAPHVARLTLNRPDRRNALDRELADALGRRIDELAGASEVRALVVTGAGSAFCAGADLAQLASGSDTLEERRSMLGAYYRSFLELRALKVPTLAAVNGVAVGAGLNLALCCDLRVLAEGAEMSAPFVRLGIHPGGGATWMLTHLAGPAAARELLMLGRPVSAERALQLGLVTEVVAAGDLESRSLEMAESLARLPRPVLTNLKLTLGVAERGDSLEAVLGLETAAQAESLASSDAAEGWAAMRERRQPRFSDR